MTFQEARKRRGDLIDFCAIKSDYFREAATSSGRVESLPIRGCRGIKSHEFSRANSRKWHSRKSLPRTEQEDSQGVNNDR